MRVKVLCSEYCKTVVAVVVLPLLFAGAGDVCRVATNEAGESVSYQQVLRPEGYVLPLCSNGLWSAYSPPMGMYRYEATMMGGEAASAKLLLEKNNEYINAMLYVKSKGTLDHVAKFRYRGEALLKGDNYRTVKSLLVERKNSRRYTSAVNFFEDGRVTSYRTKFNKIERELNKELVAGRWTHDPLSLVMTLRGLYLEKGITAGLEIFDGDKLYLLTIACKGKTRYRSLGGKREAWVLDAEYTRVDKKDKEDDMQDYKTVLYIAADSSRDFLGAKCTTPYGEILITLKTYTPPVVKGIIQ